VWRWEQGDSIPAELQQAAVLIALERSMHPPPKRKLDALAESHHLYWEKHKGWMLRLTIDVGAKVIGKRVKVRLRTLVLDEAKQRRELVIASFRTLGLTVRPRVQRRRGKAAAAAKGARSRR
jgi:hypothetical protein